MARSSSNVDLDPCADAESVKLMSRSLCSGGAGVKNN